MQGEHEFTLTKEGSRAFSPRGCRRGRCGNSKANYSAGWPHIFLVDFASTASAAANFRSLCGSLRNAPECNSQGSPIAAPHVRHGTAMSCFGVSSLFFINAGFNERPLRILTRWPIRHPAGRSAGCWLRRESNSAGCVANARRQRRNSFPEIAFPRFWLLQHN